MKKAQAIHALAALAQETRLDVFRRLVRAGQSGLAAGTLADELGIPPATLSFHLKELKSAAVVRCRRQGRSRIYSPDFSTVQALLAFLTEHCCEDAAADASSAPRRRRGRAARSLRAGERSARGGGS